METTAQTTPWHLWAVGIVSLLWNAFGANDYLQTQLGNLEYLEGAAASMDVTAEEMLAYFQNYPWYAHAFWAIGVWGAVLGSLALLLRSRWAVALFAFSLAGLAASTLYQLVAGTPDWYAGTLNTVFTILIWSIATFLLIYAASMRSRGVLR